MVTEFGDEEIAHEAIQADHEDVVRTGRKPNRPVLHSASVPLRSHPKSIQCSERAILSDETEFGLRVEEGERNSTSATNSGPLARLLHLCDGWNGGCCRFLGESLPLTQTFLESLHQVRAHVDSAGLRPLWMRFGGIHVGEEIVFIRHELIPKRRRLL